jgi:hypothetical protein
VASEIRVRAKGTEDVVSAAYQKFPQHLVAFFRDASLRISISRLISGRYKPEVRSHAAAPFEAVGIFQRKHEGKRCECSNPFDLTQEISFWVVLLADGLQLTIILADTLRQRADRLQDGPKGRPQRLRGMCSGALLWKLLAGHLGNLAPKDLTAPRTWLTSCVREPTNASRERMSAR